jgi:hypothetical protein
MSFSPWSLEMSFILFVGMIGCLEAGYRLGQRQIATGRYRNLGTVETAIDVTTSRAVMASTRLPALILALLMIVSMLSALLAGLGMAERGRSWLHVLLYAAAVTITIYTVLDLDNPRAGLIRLDAADQVLKDLLQSMP